MRWKSHLFTRCCRHPLLSLAALVLVGNIFVIRWLAITVPNKTCTDQTDQISRQTTQPRYGATFIIYDFEDFENDVVNTAINLSSIVSNVLIFTDHIPYPPMSLPSVNNIHLITTQTVLTDSMVASHLETYISSIRFVFLVPDGVRVTGNVENALAFFSDISSRDPSIAIVAFPTHSGSSTLHCLELTVDLKCWTLTYKSSSNNTTCSALDGKSFILMMKTETLLNLPSPLLRPFGEAFFIQSAFLGLRILVSHQNILSITSKPLFQKNSHSRWKHKQGTYSRLRNAYRQLGVKLVRQADGRENWFGCDKQSERCFGTVVDDMPAYIYRGQWTPPCCLRALRETGQHVFRMLEKDGIRYWLEGGSLLGAARNGDIIPWDYDIDIGIYTTDISRSKWLSHCHDTGGSLVDYEGFLWEKALEGDFYRVHYSESNRLHVDIFPFYSKNGTMTKNTWFKTHRQDTEFPESFLQPFESIAFAGTNASAPNNIKKFLEYKFGVGVIVNARLPNDKLAT